jgi:hypothetical protein
VSQEDYDQSPVPQHAHDENKEEQDGDEIGLRPLVVRNVTGYAGEILVCFIGVVGLKYVVVQHDGVILRDSEIHCGRSILPFRVHWRAPGMEPFRLIYLNNCDTCPSSENVLTLSGRKNCKLSRH